MSATAAEYAVDYVIREGVSKAVGIPGHGILLFVEALARRRNQIDTVMVRHEQSAAHLADGWARIRGEPLVVFTSVGPGAINSLVGVATAAADSIPMVVITGNCQTYFLDRGAIQDISMHGTSEFGQMIRPVVKRSWSIRSAEEVPRVLSAAFRLATSGRPGPVHIEFPMDVQAGLLDAEVPEARPHHPTSPDIHPDQASIRRIAQALIEAERPVVLAGGGVLLSDSSAELVNLVEWLGIPVLTTTQSKGVIPEDHPLNAFYTGPKGSTCGHEVAQEADLFLALGFRFAEWASGSYRHGQVFSIPPQRLIQIDIDPAEIGRNYPVEFGLVAHLKPALTALARAVQTFVPRRVWESSPRQSRLARMQSEWCDAVRAESHGPGLTMSYVLAELRKVLPRSGIVVTSSGHAQGILFQEFPVYEPRGHISAGGFSTMGFTVPAAIGVKLAAPERQVVGFLGDGDFLMTVQELATAVQYGTHVVFLVANNSGFLSIRDMQAGLLGEGAVIATESRDREGGWYTPDLAAIAGGFGAEGYRVDHRAELPAALEKALAASGPVVLDIRTPRDFPDAGNRLSGWAEFPMPANRGTGASQT